MDISQAFKDMTLEQLRKHNVKNINIQKLEERSQALNETITTIIIRLNEETKLGFDYEAMLSRLEAARKIMIEDKSGDEAFDPNKCVYVGIYRNLQTRLKPIDLGTVLKDPLSGIDNFPLIHGEHFNLIPYWKKLCPDAKSEIQTMLSFCQSFANSIDEALNCCDYDVQSFVNKYREGFLSKFNGKDVIQALGEDVIKSIGKNAPQFVKFLESKSPIGMFTLASIVAGDLSANPKYESFSDAKIMKLTSEILDAVVPKEEQLNIPPQQPQQPAQLDESKYDEDHEPAPSDPKVPEEKKDAD